jgi:putative endonuclease
MAHVYMLRSASGRFYIGATEHLEARIDRHNSGMVHSTKRLGLPLELVAARSFTDMTEALAMERQLKKWKNPAKALNVLLSG